MNSVSLVEEDINAKTQATYSGLAGSVVHDRKAELAQHHEDCDLVSVCLASSGLCAPFSLFLRFGLRRDILALASGRSPSSGGAISCFFAVSGALLSCVRLRRATNGHLVERRDWTARARANFRPARGQCPSLRIRVFRRSGTAWHAGVRILRFCPRLGILRPSR